MGELQVRFLILGCNGMAGHTIALYLDQAGHDVIGFGRKESIIVKSIVGDVKDKDLIESIIEEGTFDAIVNCVGILNNDAQEHKAEATYVNAYLPHLLADLTQNKHTKVIHLSTDCVFSGKRGHYQEHDLRDGETFYDRSKALGELDDDKNLTLRNSIIGPDMNSQGIGLFNWFMKQSGSITGYSKAKWTGLTTLQLAKVIAYAAEEDLHGIIHAVPNESISKYELLVLFNIYFKNSATHIEPVDHIVLDKSLVNTRDDFQYQIPGYEEMIAEMYFWIMKHASLYKHYQIAK